MASSLNNAHLLLLGVMGAGAYLVFRCLESGLLGSLSVRYFAWRGMLDRVQRLELEAEAERASLVLPPFVLATEKKQAFDAEVDKVPVDEATGEAIIRGPDYDRWIRAVEKALKERGVEAMTNLRLIDVYYRETFCKMTQNLAPPRAWKDANDMRQKVDLEFQDIVMWASKIKPGWERSILQQSMDRAEQVRQQEMGVQHAKMMEEEKRQLQKQRDRLLEISGELKKRENDAKKQADAFENSAEGQKERDRIAEELIQSEIQEQKEKDKGAPAASRRGKKKESAE